MSLKTQRLLDLVRVALLFLVLGVLAMGLKPKVAQATILQQLPFSARLQTTGYTNPPDGTYNIRFSIYTVDRTSSDPYPSDSDAGSRLWSETQSVAVTRGAFSVLLGASTSIAAVDFTRDDLYLGMRVESDSEMIPRKRVAPGPQALMANAANSLQPATAGGTIQATSNLNVSGSVTASSLNITGGLSLATLGATGQNISVNSSLIPSAGGLNLGSSGSHWANLYVDNLTVDTTSVAGTTAAYFIANTDAAADETGGFRTYRGPVINSYATLQWDAANTRFNLYANEGASTLGNLNMGALTVSACTGCASLSGLTAATATNTLANANYAQVWNWDTLTTQTAMTFGSTSISSGTLLSLSVNSTAAASNTQKALNISTAGANATATQITYGFYATNTHTGATSTNVGGYFSASGGTNNYGLIVAAGNAGIGLTAPTSLLHVQQAADSTNTTNPVAFDINSVGAAGELTAASGTQTFARIAPTVNQSGTAAYTALLVNSTETAVGSGARKLLDLQRGGTSKFYVDTSSAATRAYIGSDTGASDTSYLYFNNDTFLAESPYIYSDSQARLYLISTGNRSITIEMGEDGVFYIQHGSGGRRVNLTTAVGATGNSWQLARAHSSQGATTTSGSLLYLTSATDASVGYTTTGIFLNMTTTGAAYSGSLIDLQVGSASKFKISSGGQVIYPASATQSITGVGSTILANATMVVLDPNADYILTSAPTIANGTTGQILYITAGNAEANIVTVQDQDTLASSNLQLGAASRAISGKDVLVLMFDGTDWLEVSYANN